MSMKIAWVTVRRWDEMCTTTTDALVRGLVNRGHYVTILNSDTVGSHDSFPWKHVALKQSNWPGRKGATLARSAREWFKENTEADFDVILVDWPLATAFGRNFVAANQRLVLMDRSPPADATFLAKLQWRGWSKAWSMLRKGVFSHGLVVSNAHRDYVVQRTSVDINKVECIPAGVELDDFQHTSMRKEGPWKFVYHGRLDKHRGVLALPMLMRKLLNKGFEVHLTLIGDGDVLRVLQEMAENEPFLSVISQIPRQDIPSHLQKQHIGLLPMPQSRVWTLASPLKRSEYLASGLFVYGIDHGGHRIHGDVDAWFKLAPQEDFHETAGEWIQELSKLAEDELQVRSRLARAYAETHCSWETSVLALERVLQLDTMER